MRDRKKIVASLESAYREELARAEERSDVVAIERLDFEFQRDQVFLEVLLDVREALVPEEERQPVGKTLLEKAETLKKISRLKRF